MYLYGSLRINSIYSNTSSSNTIVGIQFGIGTNGIVTFANSFSSSTSLVVLLTTYDTTEYAVAVTHVDSNGFRYIANFAISSVYYVAVSYI
jgi:hypothetical protein